MSPWERLLEQPAPQEHFVQLYGSDTGALIRNVSRYLYDGYRHDDGLVTIATPDHTHAFCRELQRLGADTDSAIRHIRLAFLDAEETLAQFMVNGQPDWARFQDVVGTALGKVRPSSERAGLRAYGEMVGLLWKGRQYTAALRLEQFWNKLLSRSSFNLFCAYAIDIFGDEFQVAALDELLCAHTHLVPSETQGDLEKAIDRAIGDVLGSEANSLRVLIKANYRPSWAVLPVDAATVLWLRQNRPEQARKILARAQAYYEAARLDAAPAL
jgi:MEDS: MEthanogen/methylotroph, DcmR Sensory domain